MNNIVQARNEVTLILVKHEILYVLYYGHICEDDSS